MESDRLIKQEEERGEKRDERQGRTQEKKSIIRKLLLKGKTIEETADLLDMPAEQIRNLMEKPL